ncbi:MAG: glycosyltransferase family 2 protein [bacterium]
MIPVIIPHYKKKKQLEKCLNHLKNQTVEVELFVRDNTVDNIYFTAAINEGIRNYLDHNNNYIIILNQDMYLESNAIEEMVKFMEVHPDCGIGTPLQVHNKYPDYVIYAGSYEAFPVGRHQHGPLSLFTEDTPIFWANGACMILRKTMIQEIGLLDKNFIFIGSDSDYSFTARSRGWQVWRIANARGIHEVGAAASVSDAGDASSSSEVNAHRDIELLKLNDMLYFAKKWLCGGLYGTLAYEGTKYTPDIVNAIMARLEAAKMARLKNATAQ